MACFLLCQQKADRQLAALGVRAAEAIVRIDGASDAQSLPRLADAHHVNGDTTKTKEFAVKAMHASREERPALRLHIEKEAERFGCAQVRESASYEAANGAT